MYSAYKLKKQSDNIQRWGTPFPILNQSIVSRPVQSASGGWERDNLQLEQQKMMEVQKNLHIKGNFYLETNICMFVCIAALKEKKQFKKPFYLKFIINI